MFSRRAIGLDIADHTIEVVELEQSFFSSTPALVSRARMPLEKGIVEHGRLMNRKGLLDALATLWRNTSHQPLSPNAVIVGIPERQVYTSVVTLETVQGSTLNDQIREYALETIPLEKDDLTFSFKVISKSAQAYDVMIYGTSREVLGEWRDFFDNSPYHVQAFDHELLAGIRGLFGKQPHPSVCIVDCGAERTKIAIYSSHGLGYVHSLEIAGDFFTEQIAKTRDVSKEEADRIKKEEGMEPVSHRVLFEKLLQPIIDEITIAREYFEKNAHERVNEIILIGGSARMKGLVDYIQETTGIRARQGVSFISFPRSRTEDSDQLHYIEAIGLALRGIQPRIWEAEHPSFHLEE